MEEDHDCWICMEGGAAVSRCKCTDRFVHDACLLKWLNTANSTNCPVCLESYATVKLKTTNRRSPSNACWGTLTGSLCFVALLVCGSLMLHMWASPDFISANVTLAVGLLMIGLSVVGVVVCAVCGLRFRREGFRWWDVRSRREVVMRCQSSTEEIELPSMDQVEV